MFLNVDRQVPHPAEVAIRTSFVVDDKKDLKPQRIDNLCKATMDASMDALNRGVDELTQKQVQGSTLINL